MADKLLIVTEPSLLVPNPNPMVATSMDRHIQGAESHTTLLVGHVRSDRSLQKTMPLTIVHASKGPIYNLTLSRPETLEPWLNYCNVNFLGTPLPMIHPAGIQKFGLPSLGALPELSLPTIGLPSIPFPSFSFSLPNFMQFLTDLIAFFVSIGNLLGALLQNFLNALLQDLIEQIKLALPTLSLTVPIEWFVNLMWTIGPLNLLGILPRLGAIPAFAWPIIAGWDLPTIQFGPLPEIPGVDMSALASLLNDVLGFFTGVAGAIGKGFMILMGWLSALADHLGAIIAAFLANFNINLSFPFPGLDFGQFPPAGTPWPAPFPAQTAVVPSVQWPSWMKSPIVSNIPGPLPPGTSMAAATSGTFAMTSVPGYTYFSTFDLEIKSGLAPGIYTQEFYLEGTMSPAGTPLQKIGKINLVAQVLEKTMTQGIRPYGAITY